MCPNEADKTVAGRHDPLDVPAKVDRTAISLPKSIGGYRIEELIGTGGMSHVFRATSAEGEQPVALKVLDARFSANPEMQQRFRREVSAIQSLQDEHIVPLIAHGEDHGVPYLAMKLINGVTFGELIQHLRQMSTSTSDDLDTIATSDESSLADTSFNANATVCYDAIRSHRSILEDLTELVAVAADAIEAAHRQGIVHRDIKPSNLMLDNEGRVWLTDFGLASVEEAQTVVTKSGEMIGTPHYMSPEQATADRKTIDHRTDIYSLGATLYELLTLQRPYQGERFRVLMEISTGKLTPPTQICPEIPRPLESIILKAMQYAPQDRYQTAAAMSDDLRRYVRGKSISAKQPHLADHAVRWIVRNPRLAIGSVLGLTALGLLIMGIQYVGSERLAEVNKQLGNNIDKLADMNQRLYQSRSLLRRHLYVADVAAAYRAYELRDLDAVDQLLTRHIPDIDPVAQSGDLDLRGYEWRLLRQLCKPPEFRQLGQHRKAAREVALIPTRNALLSVGDDGDVVLRDLNGLLAPEEFPIGGRLDAVAAAPDGSRFAIGENDVEGENRVSIRRLDNGEVIRFLTGHEHSIESLAFSSDGALVAVASRYLDLVLHRSDGEELGRRRTDSRNESIAFSHDDKQLLAIVRNEDRSQFLQAFSVPDLKPMTALTFDYSPSVFACSADGQRVVVADGQNITLCRWPDGETLLTQSGIRGRIRCVTINHAGTRIYAGCDNGTLYVWTLTETPASTDLEDETLPLVVSTGSSKITSIDLTENEEAVVTTESGSVQIWQTVSEQEIPFAIGEIVQCVAPTHAFAKDVYVRLEDGRISRLDLETNQFHPLVDVEPDRHRYLALAPNGEMLVASAPNALVVVSSKDGQIIDTIQTGVRDDPTDGLAFSSDGSRIFHLLNDRFQVFGSDPSSGKWDRIREVMLNEDGVSGMTVAPNDGRIVVNLSATSELRVFDGKTFDLVKTIPCRFGSFTAMQFSDDGKLLALGYRDGTVEVVDAVTFDVKRRLQGHRTVVSHCILTNGNSTLISGSEGQIRFWDLLSDRELSDRELSGRELGVLASRDQIHHLHFSPQHECLYTFHDNQPVQVWPASIGPSVDHPDDPRPDVIRGPKTATR